MSGADDQRGAEPDQCRYCPNDADRDEAGFLHCIECGWTDNAGKVVGLHETIDRLRAELAETRDRRDYLQGQLDIIYDAEYSRNDALKRRIEKLTAAGDALAAAGRELYDSKTWSGKALTDARQAFIDAHAGWRSVRGDAPTGPPADADEPTPWDDLPAADHHLTLALCYAARATRNAVGSSEPRLTSTTAAWMAEWLIDHGWAPVPVDDEADGLTAEQYRHLYDDLIRGLAVDLGLDPEKAGGGSVTAAVRRLVAAQNSHGGDQ